MSKTPTGFIAKCLCDRIVGAMDYKRTDKKSAGKLLGEWLHNGCTIQPVFDSNWSVKIQSCNCLKDE